MNKSKIMLSTIAAVAAVSVAFALKNKKVQARRFLYDRNINGTCTTAQVGYAYLPADVLPALRSQYRFGNATITDAASKECTPKYYHFL